MKLPNLFPNLSKTPPERTIYALIVAKARQPWLYLNAGVPDTVTGRFDMITLHIFLILEHLRSQDNQASGFGQALFDEMFLDMDHSLREMGVGDLSVGKKVRKMSEVFYGACDGYRKALMVSEAKQPEMLTKALKRNVTGAKVKKDNLENLVQYTLGSKQQIDKVPVKTILSGNMDWPELTLEG